MSDLLETVERGSVEWRSLLLSLDQGTDEWRQARAGMITASRMSDLLAKTKTGYGAGRKNYMAELMIERLTGIPTEHFVSPEMRWGTEHEPEARFEHELRYGVVTTVGLVVHPVFDFSAASPDGLLGDDEGVEIKCPNTATHIETFITRKVPANYLAQIQWAMACTGRRRWRYSSFDPRVRDSRFRFCSIVVNRDQAWIDETTLEVQRFEEDLREKLAAMIDAAERFAE